MALIASLRPLNPTTTVVDLHGDVTAQADAVLTDALRQASAARVRTLILNFSSTGHINGAGLGRLILLHARARRQGQRLLAYALSALHRQVFWLTRLDEAIEVHAGETEAVAAALASIPGQPIAATPADGIPARDGWAAPVSRLKVTAIPAGVANLNVEGRQLFGPVQGFGPLLQKTYEITLAGASVTPLEVIQAWKASFGSFWPKGNRFYGRPSDVVPGDVAVLHLAGPGGLNPPGGLPLIATGLMVIYADDVSFSFMASAGHSVAGIITFSAHESENGTVVRIEPIFRSNDPFAELMFRLGIGNYLEDTFWLQILRNVARSFGVMAEPQQMAVCVDAGLQWSKWGNIWQNSAIHTTFYNLGAPFRWAGGLLSKKQPAQSEKD